MSQAPNGSFFIVNKTPTSDGKLLAITYNGVNGALTVTEFKNLNTQLWILAPYDTSTQTISPKNDPVLVAGTEGSNFTVKSLSSGRHNWIIKLSGALGVYTIIDAGLVNTWYIKTAAVGESIAKGPGSHSVQEWQLVVA